MKEPFNSLRNGSVHKHSAEVRHQMSRALFSSVADGQDDEVTAMLEGGADINAYDDDGNTPLLAAIKAGQDDMALLLIEKGADPDLPDRDGWGPLLWAVYKEKKNLVEELTAHKADLEARTPDRGATALTIAVENRLEWIAVHLVRAGANPNAMAKDQDRSLLMMAIDSGKEILMRDLFKYGANVSPRDANGASALSLAREHGKEDLAGMIVKRAREQHTNKIKSAFLHRRRGVPASA